MVSHTKLDALLNQLRAHGCDRFCVLGWFPWDTKLAHPCVGIIKGVSIDREDTFGEAGCGFASISRPKTAVVSKMALNAFRSRFPMLNTEKRHTGEKWKVWYKTLHKSNRRLSKRKYDWLVRFPVQWTLTFVYSLILLSDGFVCGPFLFRIVFEQLTSTVPLKCTRWKLNQGNWIYVILLWLNYPMTWESISDHIE